eukprot:1976859-Pyramimonas_sp.AAC.1
MTSGVWVQGHGPDPRCPRNNWSSRMSGAVDALFCSTCPRAPRPAQPTRTDHRASQTSGRSNLFRGVGPEGSEQGPGR